MSSVSTTIIYINILMQAAQTNFSYREDYIRYTDNIWNIAYVVNGLIFSKISNFPEHFSFER